VRFLRKSQKKERQFKGEITAFLALLFVLMLSLVGALVESASIQMAKSRKRADMVLALESVFAEYDKEMLDQYDLFVRNGCEKNTLVNRLNYYGVSNMTHSIQRQERLTDRGGKPFREQAIRYAKNWLGIKNNEIETENVIFSEGVTESDVLLGEEESVQAQLKDLLAQEEAELPEENNPLTSVQNLKNMGLLTLVSENPEELSNRSIQVQSLPTERELKVGNWEKQETESNADKVFLAAYLTEHFGNAISTEENHALNYEQEYLLGGYPSDKDNLEKVCKQILGMRMAANYAYLLTDNTKQAEAEALSLTLCSLLTVPGITKVVKHALLLAWAYGESIVDVRVLLKGKKLPAVKTADTWQLQLANLMKLGTDEEMVNETDTQMGLGYQSYLTGLLLAEDKEALSMRSLNLIESNLHIKTDECMTKVKIESSTVLRRGVKDSFITTFAYQ
jgi:hypothetical protein